MCLSVKRSSLMKENVMIIGCHGNTDVLELFQKRYYDNHSDISGLLSYVTMETFILFQVSRLSGVDCEQIVQIFWR